jgi:hypothetical protein
VNNDFAKTSHNTLFMVQFVRSNASHFINIETDKQIFALPSPNTRPPPSHALIPLPDLRPLDAPQFIAGWYGRGSDYIRNPQKYDIIPLQSKVNTSSEHQP